MMRIDIKFTGIERLASDLEKVAKKALPYAMRDAVNTSAFEAKRVWGDQIRRTFETRNTFTAGRAIQVDKARGSLSGGIEATVGSVAKYMRVQEHGGTVRGRA